MTDTTRLAHAARAGDKRALEDFVRASYPDVWRLCATLVDEQAADDLAQETFVRATRALLRFRGQSSARTWILAIAHNVCVDELRGRLRRRARDERIAATTTSDALLGADPAEELAGNDLLAVLDQDRRAAFVLTQIFRLSYEQAASICNCPAGTIRSRVARARDQLIVALGAEQSGARGLSSEAAFSRGADARPDRS